MNSKTILPNSLTDKIADPAERARIVGSPLPSAERHAKEEAKVERELHKLIANELLRRGIFAIHSRMDKRSTQAKGVPDFCFVVRGVPIAVECKTEKGQLSREQELVRVQMESNGWLYFVVRDFKGFQGPLLHYIASEGSVC